MPPALLKDERPREGAALASAWAQLPSDLEVGPEEVVALQDAELLVLVLLVLPSSVVPPLHQLEAA